MAQVIAGHVLTMLGEVSGESQVWGTMKTRDESFDDRASYELERTYAR